MRCPHHSWRRNAPRLDVFHPVEEGLLPAFGDDLDPPVAHRLHRRLRQLLGIDVPLVGQPRLDHHAAAVAERGRRSCGLRCARAGPARRASRPRGRAPRSGRGRCRFSGIRPSAVCVTRPAASSMLSISAGLKPALLPTSKSLKSCPGVILTAPLPSSGSACSSKTIGISRPVIGSFTRAPLATRLGVALVARMHRHRHVGEHRFRTRRGDRDMPFSLKLKDT